MQFKFCIRVYRFCAGAGLQSSGVQELSFKSNHIQTVTKKILTKTVVVAWVGQMFISNQEDL